MFISERGRLIDDLLEFCDMFNKEGLLVIIDIEKAFDSAIITFLLRYSKSLVLEIHSVNRLKFFSKIKSPVLPTDKTS